jgi:hypothetical protein
MTEESGMTAKPTLGHCQRGPALAPRSNPDLHYGWFEKEGREEER